MRVVIGALPVLLCLIGAAPAPERSFMLTDFDRVRLDGPFSVEVTSGKPTGATVTGGGRATDRVHLRVDGGLLVIGVNNQGWDGWRDARDGQPVIRVHARTLRGARVNGGGSLRIDRLAGQRIDIGVNGSGDLQIDRVEGDQMVAALTGAGRLQIGGGSVRTARVTSQGAGSVDVQASASDLTVQSQSSGDSRYLASLTATIMATGSGAVRVEGKAVCRLSGPAPMSCAGKTAER